jgi:hypothetical protein
MAIYGLLRILPQKPRKDCAAISSASPVDTRTAEWIAAQMNTGLRGFCEKVFILNLTPLGCGSPVLLTVSMQTYTMVASSLTVELE